MVSILILLYSCSSKDPLTVQHDQITSSINSDKLQNSSDADVFEDSTDGSSDEATDQSRVFNDILNSINNDIITLFPEIPMIHNSGVIPFSMTEANIYYYNTFVGSYIDKDLLNNNYISRHIYEISVDEYESVFYYTLGKFMNAIIYRAEDKMFHEVASGGSMPITNIETYQLPSGWVKISGLTMNEYYIENAITQKIESSSAIPDKELDSVKIRQLLLSFFTNLSQKNYEQILETDINKKDFNWITYSGSVSSIPSDQIIEYLESLYECFSYNNYSFKMYANVFFSEDYSLIYDNFGDCIFIELMYPNKFNYFSFCINNIDGVYRIIGYRNGLDQE